MPAEDLARTALLGVLAALVAFEAVVATVSWLAARSGGPSSVGSDLWLSRPAEIRRHLAVRRREFDAVRRQYPVLRSPHHGHEIRNAIRHLAGPRYPHIAVRQPATRPLLPGT
jgi:hypothetical protein